MTTIKQLPYKSQLKCLSFIRRRGTTLNDRQCVDFEISDIEILNLSLNSQVGEPINGYSIPGCFVHYAIEDDDTELLEHLCKHGVDVILQDLAYAQRTPMEMAYELGRADMMKILMSYGALTQVRPNQDTRSCSKPLYWLWKLNEQVCLGHQVDHAQAAQLLGEPGSIRGTKSRRR